MRRFLIWMFLASLMGCAQVDCAPGERDGGIGGTGNCPQETPLATALAAATAPDETPMGAVKPLRF